MGFAFKLPEGFQPKPYAEVGRKLSECYPKDATWNRPMVASDRQMPPAAGSFCRWGMDRYEHQVGISDLGFRQINESIEGFQECRAAIESPEAKNQWIYASNFLQKLSELRFSLPLLPR